MSGRSLLISRQGRIQDFPKGGGGGGGGGGFETRHMKSGVGLGGAVRLRPRWVSSYLYISRR